jgi:hypothetical protein
MKSATPAPNKASPKKGGGRSTHRRHRQAAEHDQRRKYPYGGVRPRLLTQLENRGVKSRDGEHDRT